MRSLLITILFLSCFCASLSAQKGGKVSGSVQFSGTKPGELPGATLSLLRAKDSATKKFTVSAKDGSYKFEDVADGMYLISATSVGHKKVFSSPFELSAAQPLVQLAPLKLAPAAGNLYNVTVTAKRPLVEQKVDRTIINVEASITNTGSSALEVLEKSPGVLVDKDGNISLKGKEGVLVLIDGRPTQLGGTDLANLLRSMNASSMDQIEIMTNPPARFDAAGNAGVINIKTKKNKTAGYNGSATIGYTQGRYPKANEGFNFNYKEGKVNLFTNFNHNYRKNFERLTIQRRIRNSATNELENYFDQAADEINSGNSYNGRIGLDYFASRRTTLGVAFSGFSSLSRNNKVTITDIASSSKEHESTTRAFVANESPWKNFSTNLYFRRQLDTTGKELTSDFDYITYNSDNGMRMINSYFDAEGVYSGLGDTLQGALPQHIRITSGRVDYYHPMKKGAKFEAGIKSSMVQTDNNALYDSVRNGSTVQDRNRSNHFLYEENINAAYVNLSGSLSKKWSTQLGLRLENTHTKGSQLTTGETFIRHYTQLFPTAYFQYKANEKHNFGLSYGRRIRRPNYESLNPFIRFIDRYTYNRGNPDLKPQFSHNIELTHTHKNALTTTLNYTATNDIIQGVIEQKGQEAYATQANIASLRQYGLSISYNKQLNKWWTNSLYLNVFNNNFSGVVNNAPIAFSATSFSVNMSQQFKLSKTLSAELNGMYRSPGVQGVIRMQSRGGVMAGFSQQVLKNKGNVRLTVRDIFYTQKGRASTKYGNVDATFQEVSDTRGVSIGFTYRFSKGKMNAQKKRTSGSAGEEQERVGVN